MNLNAKIYHDDEAARRHFEAIRWPNGPECPHCGVVGEATELKGKSTRPGVYKCRACRKPFSATVGTLFERSKIPLCKWLLATHLLTASKKGMSAHQLWRMLGFGSYRTAWFMAHRIRESMREIMLVIAPELECAAQMKNSNVCTMAAFNKYLQSNRLLMETFPPPMPPDAIITQRRLQEEYCTNLANCLIPDPENPHNLIPYSVTFSKCLRDEAKEE
jgi:transposase-like protein